MMRYRRIESKFCACIPGSLKYGHSRTTSCVMPSLLPSLLAACGPSTELCLIIDLYQGKPAAVIDLQSKRRGCDADIVTPRWYKECVAACVHSMGLPITGSTNGSYRCSNTEAMRCAGESLFELVTGSIDHRAGLSSFSARVKQHLTELTLTVDHGKRGAQPLEGLCMLTALRKLRLHYGDYDLSGETLHLKLPCLGSLHMSKFRQGGLVLTCPNLAEACLDRTRSLRVKIEEAALTSLVVQRCREAQFALRSAVDQLQSLNTLRVEYCSEAGRHLIEDIGMMRRLRDLVYDDIPLMRMPKRFPENLQTMRLYSYDWFPDVAKPPVAFAACLDHDRHRTSWDHDMIRPLPELFPTDSLDHVQLAALEGILMCTATRGMEANACLLSETCDRSYVMIVGDLLESKGKGKLLQLQIPRKSTSHEGNYNSRK